MQEKPNTVELSGTIKVQPVRLSGNLTVVNPEPPIDTWEVIRRIINLDRIAEYVERFLEFIFLRRHSKLNRP